MTDLAEFLLARIAEDEAEAHDAIPRRPTLTEFLLARIAEDKAEAQTCVDCGVEPVFSVLGAKRVLAECDTKRRIVEKATRLAELDEPNPEISEPAEYRAGHFEKHFGLWLLQVEALPYADHEQFRDEWRV